MCMFQGVSILYLYISLAFFCLSLAHANWESRGLSVCATEGRRRRTELCQENVAAEKPKTTAGAKLGKPVIPLMVPMCASETTLQRAAQARVQADNPIAAHSEWKRHSLSRFPIGKSAGSERATERKAALSATCAPLFSSPHLSLWRTRHNSFTIKNVGAFGLLPRTSLFLHSGVSFFFLLPLFLAHLWSANVLLAVFLGLFFKQLFAVVVAFHFLLSPLLTFSSIFRLFHFVSNTFRVSLNSVLSEFYVSVFFCSCIPLFFLSYLSARTWTLSQGYCNGTLGIY